MKTNRLFFVAIGVLAGIGLPLEARAQNYPSRPITFVVPFAAGGLSDVPGRMLAAEMQGRIGQSIVVENRPGASGVTGAQSVLRAEPYGYTLLVNALADVQNLHYLSVPYDPIKDFALIGMVADEWSAIQWMKAHSAATTRRRTCAANAGGSPLRRCSTSRMKLMP